MEKEKAVLVTAARAYGKGSDPYKGVTGLPKKALAEIRKKYGDKIEILIPSNTTFKGERYKRVVFYRGRPYHRVAIENDYEILKVY